MEVAADGEQTLADADQTLGGNDQTLSDADQTAADSDQTAADSDQTAADKDQLAADRDQLASDRDLASGVDQRAHDQSQDIRECAARERERTADQRDQTARARLQAADKRDEIAFARDGMARARDLAADARNIAMTQLDAASRQDEDGRLSGIDVVLRAARQRRRAAQHRAKAAEQRELAAEDRERSAQDRAQAAAERRHASADREALVAEVGYQQELRAQALHYQHRAEQLARTLQRTLSPPSLPHVEGLDVAVHYEPAAPEDVGGDFYDLFPLASNRMGFFLGDVCGKGPEAAAVTSLARYTMRTAAMLHETPDAILLDLNAALIMDSSQQLQTCTAIYGEIDMRAGATAIKLAVAGHPPPLIVRSGGAVETTSAHGTMLGVIDGPAFRTCEIDLGPGDAIVLSSDGIFDTQIDATRVDEQRLAEMLSGAPNADAQAVVDRLVFALSANRRPLRDDVAIMVLRKVP